MPSRVRRRRRRRPKGEVGAAGWEVCQVGWELVKGCEKEDLLPKLCGG